MLIKMLNDVRSGLVDASNAIDVLTVYEGSEGFRERFERFECHLDALLRELDALIEWTKPEDGQDEERASLRGYDADEIAEKF